MKDPEGDGRPPTLRRLVADGVRDALSLDAKVWRTFRALFIRPGALTVEYMEGRRSHWLRPVQLFLLANLIYFFVQPYTGFSGYNTPLQSHVSRQVYSDALGIRGRVLARIAERSEAALAEALRDLDAEGRVLSAADTLRIRERVEAVQEAVYVTRFDARVEVFARSLVILMVPLLALATALLYLGSGRSGVRHAVFALHLQAWNLTFIGSLFLLALGLGARAFLAISQSDAGAALSALLTDPAVTRGLAWVMEQGSVLVIAPYYYLAIRRAYGDVRIAAAVRTLLLLAATIGAMIGYRLILFWTTYLTM